MESYKNHFDKIIDRKGTNAMSIEGYRGYLFDPDEDLSGKYPEEEFIPMWVADMEFAIASPILAAMKQRLEHPLLGYSMVADPRYALSFQKWCRDRYDWTFDLEHLVHSKGVVPALFSLIGLIGKPGEKALIITPSYAFFKHASDANQVEILCSDLIQEEGRFRMDMEDIKAKASDEKCVLGIFCSPHNPTGIVWSESELRELGEICLDNNLMVISDEIHCDLLRGGVTFTPMAKLFPESDQIITCMAPSKTFNLAGNSFANLIIPNEDLRTRYKEEYLPVENPLSIVAAQAAYTDGHAWLEGLTEYLDDNFVFLKEQLNHYLPHAEFTIPESTYLAWVNLSYYFPDGENLTLFFARNAGVLLEGGDMFVANADGYVRLNLACPRARLEVGIARIVEAVLER